jgi:hypothetical protein
MLLAFIAAIAVAALRAIMFHTGRVAEPGDLLFVHFMAIVTVVFFSNKSLLERDRNVPITELLRIGLRNASVYALLTAVFIWMHYETIEAAAFPDRIEELIRRGLAEGQDEGIIRPRIEKFFTPVNYATLTFFALMIAGAINALLIGILHHKFLRNIRR